MFTLFYGFWDHFSKKESYFILILGLDNSGKTTFLEHAKAKFCTQSRYRKVINLSKTTPTVGLNVGKIERDGIVLNFWDLGGQKELQLLWDKYYSEAHALIWFIDSSDQGRLDESSEAFKRVMKHENTQNLPLLFVLNKQDSAEAVPPKTILETFGPSLNQLAKNKNPFLPIPLSALEGIGLKESLDWLVTQVKASSKQPSDED